MQLPRFEYAKKIARRVADNQLSEHLDHHTYFRGVSIASIVEDIHGNEAPRLGEAEKGFLRYLVVNESHRCVVLQFQAEAVNRSSHFCRTGDHTCDFELSLQTFKGRRAPVPHENALEVEVQFKPPISQEIFKTSVRAICDSPAMAKGKIELKNSILIGTGRSTQMPRNYLAATGKAVSKLAGPLAAPLDFLLSLYEDERSAAKEERFNALFAKNQEITETALAEILDTKQDLGEIRKALLGIAAYELDSERRSHFQLGPSPLGENGTSSVLMTEKTLTDELVYLFADNTPLFMTTIKDAGFPIQSVEYSNTAKVLFSRFVASCRGLDSHVLKTTFEDLAKEKPGSAVLRQLKLVFAEYEVAITQAYLKH